MRTGPGCCGTIGVTLGQISPPRLAELACGSDVPTRPVVIVPRGSRAWNASWTNSLRYGRDRYPRAGRQAEPLGGVTAVDRDGNQSRAVRIGDQFAGRDGAEHFPVGQDQLAVAKVHEHGAARLDADFRRVRTGDRELDIAEPV